MAFLLDEAHLLALFVETIAFGIFLTFFIILTAICFATDRIRLANPKFAFSVATVMMLLATAHLILEFVRGIQGFTTGDATRKPDPIPYFANVANPLDATRNFLYGLQTILGDAVLIWRCYMVYNKSLYILISAGVVLSGNIAFTVLVTWSFHTIAPGENYYQTGAWKFVTGFISITMVLNISCTFAIVFKIWRTHRRVSSISNRSLFPVIAIIIESGAIYTASITAYAITLLLKSNGQHAAFSIITPLVGVVFCLIVLQIHLHLRLLQPSTIFTGGRSFNLRWRRTAGGETGDTGTVAVHILEDAHTNQDSSNSNITTSKV